MPSHKSFRTKQKLAKAQKQNRPIPQWIRLRTGNTIRYEETPREPHETHTTPSEGTGARLVSVSRCLTTISSTSVTSMLEEPTEWDMSPSWNWRMGSL
ncbi:hypothetical protein GGS26DRAFT_587240 [Hypomontagnella submonticulosa]|nr:hypothetical protein GGS26DRAFT_587240 [Hypomontagnella submonticulosa]